MKEAFWIYFFINAAFSVAVFVSGLWIKTRIEKGIQSTFETKLENLRTELRKNEELLKSELRTKESEISAIRDGVFGGQSSRQTLMDKRRFEAVEKIWAAVVALESYKLVSSMMAVFKFNEIARLTPDDENLRTFFGSFAGGVKPLDMSVGVEQLFVSSVSWAHFSAYKAILTSAVLRAKLLELGVRDAHKAIDSKQVKEILKAALPHHTKFIEEHEPEAFHYLLDELNDKLRVALISDLEARVADQKRIEESARIMAVIRDINKANEVKS